MFKPSLILWCLFVGVFTPCLSITMTDDQKAQIHAHFETVGKNCIKDNMLNEEDISNLRARKVPTGPKAPCFLACMMKEIGVMDGHGMLQKETALEMAKSLFKDNDTLKNIEDYLHSCSHVNTEAVSDGDKGCDRALMAYKCMIENASQFGFEV